MNHIKEIVFLLFVCISLLCGCSYERPLASEDFWAEEMVTGETETPETTVPRTTLDNGGILQILANGDSFYTPVPSHVSLDTDRTVSYYNNMLLVFTSRDLDVLERESLAELVDGEAVSLISGGIHAFQIKVAERSLAELEALANKLMDEDDVLYSCAEYPVQIMGKLDENPWNMDGPEKDRGNENNPSGLDWWAEAIGAYTAWNFSAQGKEVAVGIVDNGFATDHEDLIGQITMITGPESNTPADHGTMVAGIIGAKDNGVGIRGVVENANLICGDLWPGASSDSYHTMGEYLAVINYMGQCGVRVVNNSWGCLLPAESNYLQNKYGDDTQDHADEYIVWSTQRMTQDLIPTAEFTIVMISQLMTSDYHDMIHVQGAGNDGVDARFGGFFCGVTETVYNQLDQKLHGKLSDMGVCYDDIDQRILVVGAIENVRDANGNFYLADFSNFGDTVDLCAPGHIVYSTVDGVYGIRYGASGGTSLSTPMVTGSVALLLSLNPDLSVSEIRELLFDSAKWTAIGVGHAEEWTCPIVNIGEAVLKLMEE